MDFRYPQNIYLHFLDRELRDSVNADWNETKTFTAILTALCLAPGDLICAYSHLWESNNLLKNGLSTIKFLIDGGLLRAASDYSTAQQFLDSRMDLYRHDSERYPFYFRKEAVNSLQTLNPAVVNKLGATESLMSGLSRITEGGSFHVGHAPEEARAIIKAGLHIRRYQAITGTLFDPVSGGDKNGLSVVRREISYQYTQHYLKQTGSDLITGLSGLSTYDSCAVLRPLFEHSLFITLLGCAGIQIDTQMSILKSIEKVAVARNTPNAIYFLTLWTSVIRAIEGQRQAKGSPAGMIGSISAKFRSVVMGKRTKLQRISFPALIELLQSISKSLNLPLHTVDCGRNVRVAFVVATDSELQSFESVMKDDKVKLKELQLPNLAAWQLTGAEINDCVLIRSEMGSKGPGSATHVARDIIEQLHPKYIIMAGIAFGLHEDKHKLGDLLVAVTCTDYETVRQGDKEVIQRGAKYSASTELIAKARMVAKGRDDVHFGEVISGDKLVDDQVFRDQLKASYPEALGGEMEGVGLASSCHRDGSQWILVKAICDWGMAKSNEHQTNAGLKSVKFCLEISKLL